MTFEDQNRDLEVLKADLSVRLRAVCAHFPETEFAELVDQIARIETKYALRASRSSADRLASP